MIRLLGKAGTLHVNTTELLSTGDAVGCTVNEGVLSAMQEQREEIST